MKKDNKEQTNLEKKVGNKVNFASSIILSIISLVGCWFASSVAFSILDIRIKQDASGLGLIFLIPIDIIFILATLVVSVIVVVTNIINLVKTKVRLFSIILIVVCSLVIIATISIAAYCFYLPLAK